MKKSILNLGTALNRIELKQLHGGDQPIDLISGCASESRCESICDGECIQCVGSDPLGVSGYFCFGNPKQ